MSPAARRAPGEGSLFQRADGMWIGTVDLGYGGDGRRRRKTVSAKRKPDAVRKLREVKRLLAEHGDLATTSMTTAAWLTYWVENIAVPRLRPNSAEQYRSDVRLHIIPEVGRYRLDQLTPRHVRDMSQAIVAKGRSSTSALRCHRVLSKALKDAVREGKATRNVAEYVDTPAKAISRRGSLSSTEGVALLRSAVAAGDPYASRWAAALLTGARQGELLGLQWERVTDVLDLSWQLQRIGHRHGCTDGKDAKSAPACGKVRAGSCPQRRLDVPAGYEHTQLAGGLCLVRPKSRSGHRVIPLIEPLATILAEHHAKAPPNPFDLVWATPGVRPIDAPSDTKAWHAALAAAGLPDVPLHAARHTTATLLLELGVDAHVIAAILGHSDVAMTRAYQHVDQRLAREALGRLGQLLAVEGPAL